MMKQQTNYPFSVPSFTRAVCNTSAIYKRSFKEYSSTSTIHDLVHTIVENIWRASCSGFLCSTPTCADNSGTNAYYKISIAPSTRANRSHRSISYDSTLFLVIEPLL